MYVWITVDNDSADLDYTPDFTPVHERSRWAAILDDDSTSAQPASLRLTPTSLTSDYEHNAVYPLPLREGGPETCPAGVCNDVREDWYVTLEVALPTAPRVETRVAVQVGSTGTDHGTAVHGQDYQTIGVGESGRAGSGYLESNTRTFVFSPGSANENRRQSWRFRLRTIDDAFVEGTETIEISALRDGQSQSQRVTVQLLDNDTDGPGTGNVQPPVGFDAESGPARGEITLSWTAPASAPSNYKLQQAQKADDNNPQWITLADVDISESPYTVRGLIPGGQYRFRARSELQIEPETETEPTKVSPWVSTTGVAATAPVGPGAVKPPTGFTALGGPGEAEITLSWTAPSPAPPNYKVAQLQRAHDDDPQNWTWTPLSDTSATSFVVRGLAAGQQYTFGVRSELTPTDQSVRNPAVVSAWVTTSGTPGTGETPDRSPPVDFTLTPELRSIRAVWKAPEVDLGPVDYEVSWRSLGGSAPPSRYTAATSFVVGVESDPPLVPGTEYVVQVRAWYVKHGRLEANASRWVSGNAVPLDRAPAAAPEGVSIEASATSLLVSWTAPTSDGAPSDYQVRWAEDEGSFDNQRDTHFTSFNITGLKPSTRYRVQVRARYPDGRESGWVDAGARTLDPSANLPPVVQQVPASMTLTLGGTAQVDVSSTFSDPENDPLRYAARSDRPDVVSISGSGPVFTLSALAVGQAAITITATDGRPGRVPVPASFGVTVDDRPNSPPALVGAVPPLVQVEVGTVEVVSLVFTDPDGDPLRYTATSARPGVASARASVSSTGVDVSVAGISIGETAVTVLASDGRLSAPATLAVEVVPPPIDPPGPPLDVVAAAGDRSVSVRWLPGSPPGDRFRVRWREVVRRDENSTGTDGQWVDAGPRTSTSFTLENLKEATTYRLEVRSEFSVSPAGNDCPPLCSEWVGAETTTGRGNRPPVVDGEIPAVSLVVYGFAARNVSSFFVDPDGDVLTYAAVATDMTVVGIAVSGDQVVVRGLRGGSTDVAVTARDPGGLTAVQRFAVEVEPPPPPVVGVGLSEQGLIFQPGRVLRFRVEPRPPSAFEVRVRLTVSSDFLLSLPGAAPEAKIDVVVPTGHDGVDVELRERVPYFRLGELVRAEVRGVFVGPAESGGSMNPDDWPFRPFRSRDLPRSTVQFSHDGNGMTHALLGDWAPVTVLVDPPIPAAAGAVGAGSRVRVSFQPVSSIPRRASWIGIRSADGRPFDPSGWLQIPLETAAVKFQVRLGHADDLPAADYVPAKAATLFLEEVDGGLLALGEPDTVYATPDGGIPVPSIGSWGAIILGLLLAAGGAARLRARRARGGQPRAGRGGAGLGPVLGAHGGRAAGPARHGRCVSAGCASAGAGRVPAVRDVLAGARSARLGGGE